MSSIQEKRNQNLNATRQNTFRTKTERFIRDELVGRETVMQLDDVNVCGFQACRLEALSGSEASHVIANLK